MKKTIFFLGILFVVFSVGIDVTEAKAKTKKKECRYTHICNYNVEVDGVNYRVTGGAEYTRTCGKNTFPARGCDWIRAEIISRINPGNLSMSWGLSCGNTHFYRATILSTSGMCGSAHGGTFTSFPTSDLCTVGSVINSAETDTSYTWGCAGTGGGASASCSAAKQVSFDLSCAADPATGVAGAPVNFDATISNSPQGENEYTYNWLVNGVQYSDDDTFQFTFNSATDTASVKVTAQYGSEAKEVVCPFNRVDCSGGQYYCGDQVDPVSYACSTGPSSCPVASCGPGYDISLDKELAPGGTLQTTNVGNGYVLSNNLCINGNELKYVNGVSTWMFNVGYSAWTWSCSHPDVLTSANCKARCKTGEYYCMGQGACIPDTQNCDCPLTGTGTIVDQRSYCTDQQTGTCMACGSVVRYFKLSPDEVSKNQGQQCGAYWDTNPVAEENKPEGTTDTRVSCKITTGQTVIPVSSSNPEGGVAYGVGIASHELTCTQQYQLNNEPEWLDLLTSSMPAKCRALPGVIER